MTTFTARLTIRAGRRRLDVELRIPAPAGRPHLTIRTGNRMGRTPDVRHMVAQLAGLGADR